MKNLFSLFCATLLIATPVLAEDPYVSPLKKGQQSPYDGLLLNPPAAAVIMSEKRVQQDIVNAEVQRAVGQVTATFTLKLKEQETSCKESSAVTEAQLKIRDNAIKSLEEEIKKSKEAARWTPFIIAGSVLGGAALTIAGGVTFLRATK